LTDEEDNLDEDGNIKVGEKCFSASRPLDFIYELEGDIYNMTAYEDDKELLKKIQTGKGDEEIYGRFRSIFVENMFGGTEPEEVDQDTFTGKNDIKRAKAALYFHFYDLERMP